MRARLRVLTPDDTGPATASIPELLPLIDEEATRILEGHGCTSLSLDATRNEALNTAPHKHGVGIRSLPGKIIRRGRPHAEGRLVAVMTRRNWSTAPSDVFHVRRVCGVVGIRSPAQLAQFAQHGAEGGL